MSLLTIGGSGRTLSTGSKGADVVRVQRALNAAGSPALPITGTYDTRTRNAVGSYQTKVGLRANQGRRDEHVGGSARRKALTPALIRAAERLPLSCVAERRAHC